MPNIPACPEPTCERSDVYLEAERNDCFVFRCRTCKGVNVWPMDREEKRGRYYAYLKQVAAEKAVARDESSRRAYSFGAKT